MPRKPDPDNKLRDGLYVDDERKSVIEHHEDGSTSFHRYYGGEWHEHRSGDDQDESLDDE